MQDVFLIESLRTPFASFGGKLAGVAAPELAAAVINGLLKQPALTPETIDEVIIGQVLQAGSGQAPARQALRFAGLPDTTPAMTINKVCGSGLKAMMLAADAIRLGRAQLVIAGGMENMSLSPYALPAARYGMRMGNSEAVDLLLHDALRDPYTGRHMGEVTEALIAEYGLDRATQDAYAIRSYQRAQQAVTNGLFNAEIVPVVITSRSVEKTIDADEEPFRVKFDKISSLQPVFAREGTITAANASTISDGAALGLLADAEAVARYNLTPKARLLAYTSHSIHPDRFAAAPIGAIEKVCALAGVAVGSVDLFEINEAFAAVPLMAIKKLDLDPDKVNVNGGAVALGHPVGASGGRLVATVVNEMQRRQVRYGLATLCIGGGEAVAALFEKVN
ncbi:MAG: thiolase family protein [Desulfuromonadaceae bacterium]|nr:thiolase family protein [Desulfuromonadaceae bacterium]